MNLSDWSNNGSYIGKSRTKHQQAMIKGKCKLPDIKEQS